MAAARACRSSWGSEPDESGVCAARCSGPWFRGNALYVFATGINRHHLNLYFTPAILQFDDKGMDMNKIVLATLLASVSSLALAQGPVQGYVGVGVGLSEVNLDCGGTSSCDKSDTGYKIYGGIEVAKPFAIEASFIDFGKASARGYSRGYPVTVAYKASALVLNGAARAQFLPALSGVARLGLAFVSTEVDGSIYGTSYYNQSDTKAKPYLGLGLEYAFNKNIKGVLSADFTQGEVDGDSGSVQLIGVGLQYNF